MPLDKRAACHIIFCFNMIRDKCDEFASVYCGNNFRLRV
jgi:hypothetical protein